MSAASLASLAIATAGLHLVQDIIGAMHAADAAAQAANSTPAPSVAKSRPQVTNIVVRHDVYESSCCENKSPSTRPCNPSACYQSCKPYHPAVLDLKPRLSLQSTDNNGAGGYSGAHETSCVSPIEPPWKVLPYQQPAKQIVQVKVVQVHTDILTKGSLIDMFI